MADWRKLYGEINDSETFHSVPERTRLGYFQAYLETDKRGFLPWSAKKLRALAFGLTDWSIEDVETLRADLVRVGLWIRRKDAAGQDFIEVWRFDETQGEPARRAREAPSKFGDPIDIAEVHDFTSVTDTGGVPSGHLDKRRGEEIRGEESALPPSNSGGRNADARLILPSVEADFRKAHPSGDKAMIRKWDREAVVAGAHALQDLPDRVGFFRRALAALPANRQTLEAAIEKLNDPEILNGRKFAPAESTADDTLARLQRENEEILAEQVASAKRAGRSTEKLEALARQIGRPMPVARVTEDPT